MKQLTEVMGRAANRRSFLKNSMVAGGQLTAIASSSLKFENPGARLRSLPTARKMRSSGLSQPRWWNGPDNRPAVLYAFDSTKPGQPIYRSERDTARDGAALVTRFVIPLVANGRVYVGTTSEVEVYGLLKHSPLK